MTRLVTLRPAGTDKRPAEKGDICLQPGALRLLCLCNPAKAVLVYTLRRGSGEVENRQAPVALGSQRRFLLSSCPLRQSVTGELVPSVQVREAELSLSSGFALGTFRIL